MVVYEKRIIGIDFGTKRIGLACSDPMRVTAQPLPSITLAQPQEAVARVRNVLSKIDVELVVVGMPISLSGKANGQMAEQVKNFADGLRRAGYKVVLEDERFTSAEAKSTLRKVGKKERQMRGKLDSIAAQVILQDHLNEHYGRESN